MFLNFSNHSSEGWGEDELAAARQWGEIRDLPFPNVAPELDEDAVAALARDCVRRILALKPDAVLCQGEMTLCFRVTQGLLDAGVPVVAACSERIVTERQLEDGGYQKLSVFRFRRFRAYGVPRAAGTQDGSHGKGEKP